MLKHLSVLVFCLFGVHGQVPIFYHCTPIIEAQADFQLDRFLGTWYEAKTYPHSFEDNTKCVKQTFTLNANGTVNVDVNWKNTQNNEALSIQGTADMFFPAYFTSDLPIATSPMKRDTNTYWVLGTDYDNYAVVSSCDELQILLSFFAFEDLWILTRERNPSEEVLQNAMEPFTRNTYLNKNLLRTSDQTDC